MRRVLARHKLLAIVGGSVTGLLLVVGGVAFAAVAGAPAPARPGLQWQSIYVQPYCTSHGEKYNTIFGTATISSDKRTLNVNATGGTLYDDDACIVVAMVENTGNSQITISGATFSLDGKAVPASDVGVLFGGVPPPFPLEPGQSVQAGLTVEFPAGAAPQANASYVARLTIGNVPLNTAYRWPVSPGRPSSWSSAAGSVT